MGGRGGNGNTSGGGGGGGVRGASLREAMGLDGSGRAFDKWPVCLAFAVDEAWRHDDDDDDDDASPRLPLPSLTPPPPPLPVML